MQISNRVASIAHALEFDQFMSKERRGRLEKELSSLLKDRENILKIIKKIESGE